MTAVVEQYTGVMAELSDSGDTRITWSRYKPAEVDAARAHFDDLKKKGFAAFKVTPRDRKGEQIHKFDPDAEKIILVPPIVGG